MANVESERRLWGEGYEFWGREQVSPEEQTLLRKFRKENGAIDWLKAADSLDDETIDKFCTPTQAERVKYFKKHRCTYVEMARALNRSKGQMSIYVKGGIIRAMQRSKDSERSKLFREKYGKS